MKKIILFANWGLGKLVLNKLLEQDNIIITALVTQFNESLDNDKFYNSVYFEGKANDIKIFNHWLDLPNEIILESDFGLSIAFHQIFKSDILEKIKIINFHPSKLPLYRGPSPVLWQIFDGIDEIGGSLHYVDIGIDTGEILYQETFKMNYDLLYNDLIDSVNEYFSCWIVDHIVKSPSNQKNVVSKEKYYHRLEIKNPLINQKISVINKILNRKKITIFSGNRAEFGILFPLMVHLTQTYFVELILSGGHTQKLWETKSEVYKLVNENKLVLNILEIDQSNIINHYRDSMMSNYSWGFDYFIKCKKSINTELTIVLGDRVESYAFANASFFNNVPVCHLFGGDISNVPYFDTNIRHAITKISSLHLVSNNSSYNNIIRMGEEEWRVELMGNISLDNYTNNNYSTNLEIIKQYGLKDELTLLLTYHPSQYESNEENFKNFIFIYNTCLELNIQMVITYPNNDDGHLLITQFLENHSYTKNILVVKNLGIKNYLGMLKEFDCIMLGNSSSGLFETAFTATPSINIGDRQIDRPRAKNVIDLPLEDLPKLKETILNIVQNYNKLKAKNLEYYDFFGKGTSVDVAVKKITEFINLPLDKRINKKFIG